MSKKRKRNAQTAVEYLLLLAVVVVVVLAGFSTMIPEARENSSEFFNAAMVEIVGAPPAQAARMAVINGYP